MNLPPDFLASISKLLESDTDSFLSALKKESPVSIRFNPFKIQRNPLHPFDSIETPVPWSKYGSYLKERPSFTFDPLFHAGYYYVQEASSMFIANIVSQLFKDPITCLDLCAAPGGKSTDLLSVLPQGSLLVSNEIIRHRANILSETMIKFGHSASVVTNNEAKDFLKTEVDFDLILVDAPCSGEGMFRKDEISIQEWTTTNVKMCAARQKKILDDIWATLKPGGVIIYSTCTYNTLENEDNALYIANELGAEFIEIKIDKEYNITPSFHEEAKGYRFFPHKTKGEGLFITVLRKSTSNRSENQVLQHKNNLESNKKGKKNNKSSSIFLKDSSQYSKYLYSPDEFDYLEHNNRIIALPKAHLTTLLNLKHSLKIVSMGIEIGELKGKDFIPSHVLAMSLELNSSSFGKKDLSYTEAIAYLRREAISLPDSPKGFILLTFKKEPIGFVKNIGNRANNLYPKEWRIIKDITK